MKSAFLERRLGVAVAGLGRVGRETARMLKGLGGRVKLIAVCDRRVQAEARALKLPASVLRMRDWRKLLKDPRVDVVVELFGGLESARSLVLGALEAGRDVVTGNKLLLAKRWPELITAARTRGRRLRFEAAVGGGIPIIEALRTGLAANRIRSVTGILNGTSNYVLSRMAREGCELRRAVREAQRLGMAEKNPALDLSGDDTMHKISIAASLITGTWVPPESIQRQGIESITTEDIRFALEKLQRTVRLIGTIGLRWEQRPLAVEVHVQPTLVPLDHPLAVVHGGYNAVLVDAEPVGDLMFYGLGAGPGPAASAVVSDVLALAREADGAMIPTAERPIVFIPECPSSYYLKLRVRDVSGALAKITYTLGRAGISIDEIHQEPPRAGIASVMITTHETTRRRIDKARRKLMIMPMVVRRPMLLRFLPPPR